MGTLKESPFEKRKLTQKSYVPQKLKRMKDAVVKHLKTIQEDFEEPEEGDAHFKEMIDQLKEKYNESVKYSEKFRVLSVLPKSWSIRKIEGEFGASSYMIREVKKKVDEEGILCSPSPRPGRGLPKSVLDAVMEFYESDDVSRQTAGAKEFKSVMVNGVKERKQKRLLLGNLRELRHLFKERYPDINISFSKFAELRPPHCILAGAPGTHSVCVCTTHQNVKLMISGAHLDSVEGLSTYQEIFKIMLCEERSENCYFGSCQECPGVGPLSKKIEEVFQSRSVSSVVYRQWVQVDRCNLDTFEKLVPDFIDDFCKKMVRLAEHDYIAKEQAQFISSRKQTLEEGEVLVVADFAENYAFVCQDAAQGYHWTNTQATIHPFVCYYRSSNGNIEHISFVIISDCLEHTTTAVYTFQKRLVFFLKKYLNKLIKIIYVSDGAASQYKNRKNVANFRWHFEDFSVDVEWHYTATAHGKGPSDGVSGAVKRLARRASLQSPTEGLILDPPALFAWAVKTITAVTFEYVTIAEVEEEAANLETRFKEAQKLPGIQSQHTIIPLSRHAVWVQRYSNSKNGTRYQFRPEKPVSMKTKFDFCIIFHQNTWWLAKAKSTYEDMSIVVFDILHPSGARRYYHYNTEGDEAAISLSHVLLHVTPITKSDGKFSLTRDTIKLAKEEAGNKK